MRVRFAPSPSGELHIGSARTALYNFLFARHHGGSFVLRAEDTDRARSEDRFEDAILEDLLWLSLPWDEGPDRGGAYGPYRQRERAGQHRRAAAQLVERADAYYCFCSEERLERLRAEALARGRTPRYDRHCLGLDRFEVEARLGAGERAAVRLRVPDREIRFDDLVKGPTAFVPEAIGDFIILRSNGMASYNFAAAIDDNDMAITHVIRGDDHVTNTARQLLVFAALRARPPAYAHHSMVLGGDGSKLSKRHGATAVGEFRAAGYLPEAIVNYLALLSWSHGGDEVLPLARLIDDFDLGALSASPAVFDIAKLDWLDHQWIMAADEREHERRVAERLPGRTPPQAVSALAAALKPSLERYGQVPELVAAILERPASTAAAVPTVVAAAAQLRAFQALRERAAGGFLEPHAARSLLGDYRAWGEERNIGARDLLMPLRVALTGQEHGPELHFVLAAVSGEETLARIDTAIAGVDEDPRGRPATDGEGDAP